jgi:SAM-dependent methyltransferase
MRLGLFAEVTGHHTPADAWLYDRYIAPAVQIWFDQASVDLAPALAEARSLLDVGSGGGHLLAHLAERHPQIALHGIDLLAPQVARANARLHAKGSPGRTVEGTALDLPHADGTMDIVVSVASIKHWPDRARGLSECCRVLRPGGRLLLVEADRGTRLDHLQSFVFDLRFPRTVKPMLPLLVPIVRTFVHGQSLDLEEMRALSAPLPLEDVRVERVAGTSALRLFGRRAD